MTVKHKIRVVYVIYQANRWMSFEWLARDLDRERFDLHFILLHEGISAQAAYLEELGIPVSHLPFRGLRDWPQTLIRLLVMFRKLRADVVHAHFINAGLTALPAARLAGVPARIYTRHHAAVTSWHPRSRLGLFHDRLNNRFASRVVVPSALVERAVLRQDAAPAHKVVLNHHGFDLKVFGRVSPQRVDRVRAKYGIKGRPVIGVVSRYLELKGIHYTIAAYKELRKSYPEALLVLASAFGRYRHSIRGLLTQLPDTSYLEIHFEEDMPALFKTFDIFVHVPLKDCEAFGQVYVEALASGIPSVFTATGIATDFIRPEVEALVVDFQDAAGIRVALERLLLDPTLRADLVANGRRAVEKHFAFSRHLEATEQLYLELMDKAV